MASKRVYWDACAWLALINEEPSRVDGCRYIIQEAEKGELRIVTSMLTLAEVYKAKCEGGNALLPLERDAEFERYLGAPHVDPVQVDRDIGTTARRLLRSYQKWDPTTKRRSAARQGDIKRKDIMGVPHTVAMALRAQGWYWRGDVVWWKDNPLPGGRGSEDRPSRSHEQLFLFSKSASYDFDKSHLPPGSVWKIKPARWDYEDHPAPMPNELAKICILAGSKRGQTVLDPFMGAGTTAVMARYYGRHYTGYELNEDYIRRMHNRLGLGLCDEGVA